MVRENCACINIYASTTRCDEYDDNDDNDNEDFSFVFVCADTLCDLERLRAPTLCVCMVGSARRRPSRRISHVYYTYIHSLHIRCKRFGPMMLMLMLLAVLGCVANADGMEWNGMRGLHVRHV